MSKRYKKDKKDDMDEMIIALYYQMKREPEKSCNELECKKKTTCIDEEQVALVGSLGGEQTVLENNRKRIVFRKSIPMRADRFCEKAQKHGYDRRLISYKEDDDKRLREIIKRVPPVTINSIIQELPIIQSMNRQKDIDERNSICYLCLFGEQRTEFIRLILKTSLIQSISLHLDGKQIDEFVTGLDQVFAEIIKLYENQEAFNDFCGSILGCAEEYDEQFNKKGDSMQICRQALRCYYQEGCSNKKCASGVLDYILVWDEDEKREVTYLYLLLVQTLRFLRCKAHLENGDKLFQLTGKGRKRKKIPHNIYDRLEEVLESTLHKDVDDRNMVLKELSNLLKENGEESRERVDEFYNRFLR